MSFSFHSLFLLHLVMKRFIALYFFSLALLFTLFYADTSAVSGILNHIQTELTLWGLEQFLEPGQLQGIDIVINPHYKIVINQACNGMIPILFFFAAVLAYPSAIMQKLFWSVVGYVVFGAVNVLRILLVVNAVEGESGRGNFYWSHDIVGNVILMSTGLLLFVAFIKSSRGSRKRPESDCR
ncbi:MAG: exosortase/archaeosortase family protein [Sulfurimonas sp.]